jgi:hypothetical protein
VGVQLELDREDHSDLATATEAGLRDLLRRQGWKTARMPGHASNRPGPDLIAYRRDPRTGQVVMRILDNKANKPTTKRVGRVREASGLSADSLRKNLPGLLQVLGRSTNPLDRAAVALLHRVRANAESAVARSAAKAGPGGQAAAIARATMRLPKGATLVVTNVGGRAPDVSRALLRRNVGFTPSGRLELAPV